MKRERPRTKTEDNVVYIETSEETKQANDQREQMTRSQKKAGFILLAIVVVAAVIFISFTAWALLSVSG